MLLIEILQEINRQGLHAIQPTDLVIGTVQTAIPLTISISPDMAPLEQSQLYLTASVVEKKIPQLTHTHDTSGFSHTHTVSGLGHSHSSSSGATGDALGGSYTTSQDLNNTYTSDSRLGGIAALENGKPLPVQGGYITLNRGLEEGDKVMMLQVMGGQKFIVLSRLFNREE